MSRRNANPTPRIKKTGKRWLGAPLDATLIFLALAATNFWINRDDPGWTGLNPTPWLLLPVFLGGRYGSRGGISGTILAIGAILALQFFLNGTPPGLALREEPYFFLALLIGGACGSLIHFLLESTLGPEKELQDTLIQANQKMEREISVYRENEASLTDVLLDHGAEFAPLDERMRRLFAPGAPPPEQGFLKLAAEFFDVTEAAIYTGKRPGSPLEMSAVIGNRSAFQEEMRPSGTPMVAAALTARKLATCRHLWRGESLEDSAYLAAIPWFAPGGSACALLLVSHIPVTLVSWESLARLEALFSWTMEQAMQVEAAKAVTEADPGSILQPDDFEAAIEHALEYATTRAVSSSLVIFQSAPDAPDTLKADFVRALRSTAQPLDVIGAVPVKGVQSAYAIAVLRPAGTTVGSKGLAHRLLSHIPRGPELIDYRILQVEDAAQFRQQWQELRTQAKPNV